MTPPTSADVDARAQLPSPVSEQEAAWRWWNDWSKSESLRLTDPEEALHRQMEILTALGLLQLTFWDREFQDNENGKPPTPLQRVKRREFVMTHEYEKLCSDGLARWLAVRNKYETDNPVRRLVREARSLQQTIASLTAEGSKEVSKLAELISGHGAVLSEALAEADLAEVRRKIDDLEGALGNLSKDLKAREPGKWLGWTPPQWLRAAVHGLRVWMFESAKVVGGVIGAVFILAALRMIGSPTAVEIYRAMVTPVIEALQHEAEKAPRAPEKSQAH